MKKISWILLLLIGSSYAGSNVTVNLQSQLGIGKSNKDTAAMFVKEIQQFLENPMYWCSVEPTGEVKVVPTEQEDIVILKIIGRMTCHEKIAYDYFKSICNRYQSFILENAALIEEMISEKYPDLGFRALMMNFTFAVEITYKNNSAWVNRFNYAGKIKFFKMVLNDKYISPNVLMFHEHGCLIATNYDDPPSLYKEYEEFEFEVYKRTIAKGDVNIRFETVYHPTLEEYKTVKSKYR